MMQLYFINSKLL